MEALDAIDRKILLELDLNARIPETELARRIRKSREVVRYRVHQLSEQGIIKGYLTWINVAKLGYQGYKIYLKIAGDEKEQKEFFEHIRSRQDVFWLGVADGAWDVGLTFFAKSNEEFFKAKNELFARFSGIIFDKKTGILANVYTYPKKFLGAAAVKKPNLLFGNVVSNEIDDIDKRILGQLFHNSRIRLVDLANRTGVSLEVVRNRMKKLEQSGVIVRYAAVIDHTKLGMEFYKTFLYFDDLSEANEKKLLEFCEGHPNVIHVVRPISPWDVELEIMVENYAQYNGIMRQLRSLFPHELRNIESAIMSEDYVFPARKTMFD